MMLNLVTQRNTAQVQVLADSLAQDLADEPGHPQRCSRLGALQTLAPGRQAASCTWSTAQGNLVASSDPGAAEPAIELRVNWPSSPTIGEPASQLMESTATPDEVVVSFAPLPGQENWAWCSPNPGRRLCRRPFIISWSWRRCWPWAPPFRWSCCPSASAGSSARLPCWPRTPPGPCPAASFIPCPEHGPQEIRALINAFNQMVIRLAEQQTALRQYAHKALLSQEEERQRLSHELHDGTLQDLVGLAQRVELCRNELERDPQAGAPAGWMNCRGCLDKRWTTCAASATPCARRCWKIWGCRLPWTPCARTCNRKSPPCNASTPSRARLDACRPISNWPSTGSSRKR